jgi:hypothetical protein
MTMFDDVLADYKNNDHFFDPPSYIEALIMMKHLANFGRLPRWNEEF